MYKVEIDPDGDYCLYLNGIQILHERDIYLHVGERDVEPLFNLVRDALNQANKRQVITLDRKLAALEGKNNKWFGGATTVRRFEDFPDLGWDNGLFYKDE